MRKLLAALLLIFLMPHVNAQTDTINFEKNLSRIRIDTANHQNVWQIGVPGKTIFNAAHSSSHVIVTDTLHPYPANTMSSFIIDFSVMGSSPYMSFWHKYNTDSARDGGYLEFSDDNGQHWSSADTSFGHLNVYCINKVNVPHTILVNGHRGYSGSQNTWKQEFVNFPCCAVIAEPKGLPGLTFVYNSMVRFTFVSDSIQTNKEGWMIDDIVFTADNGGCSGIQEGFMYKLNTTHIFPNPACNTATLSITSAKLIRDGMLTIYDLQGKQVRQFSGINTRDYHFSLEGLDKGLYLYKFTSGPELIGTGRIAVE